MSTQINISDAVIDSCLQYVDNSAAYRFSRDLAKMVKQMDVKEKRKRPGFGLAMVLMSGLCWSSIAILSKRGIEGHLDAVTVNGARVIISAILVFAVLLLFRRSVLRLDAKTLGFLLLFGALDYGLGGMCFIGSMHFISASMAFLVLYSYPAIVVLIGVLLGREKLSLKLVLAVLLTFVGVAFILETGLAVHGEEWWGVLLVFIAALIFSVYLVLMEPILDRHSSMTVTSYTLLAGSLFMVPLLFVSPPDLTLVLQPLNIALLLFLAIVSTTLALIFFLLGVRHIGASKTAIITTVEPAFVVIIAGLWLNEVLSPIQWAGVVLQMAGVLLVHLEGKQHTEAPL